MVFFDAFLLFGPLALWAPITVPSIPPNKGSFSFSQCSGKTQALICTRIYRSTAKLNSGSSPQSSADASPVSTTLYVSTSYKHEQCLIPSFPTYPSTTQLAFFPTFRQVVAHVLDAAQLTAQTSEYLVTQPGSVSHEKNHGEQNRPTPYPWQQHISGPCSSRRHCHQARIPHFR